MSLLSIHQLNAYYGQAQALFDISLEVQRGELITLVGRNGAGKSTVLKSIIGLIQQKQGAIHFEQKTINKLAPYQIAQLGIGYVPEERRIFTDLSVLENLEVGRQKHRPQYWTISKLFELFPNLAQMPHRLGGQMSGGEQQMLAIARTLMGQPSLLLLDEPAEGIAPVIVQQIHQMLGVLKTTGVSIILSEQNQDMVRNLSDRSYTIENGKLLTK